MRNPWFIRQNPYQDLLYLGMERLGQDFTVFEQMEERKKVEYYFSSNKSPNKCIRSFLEHRGGT